jgi:hypothetical protein
MISVGEVFGRWTVIESGLRVGKIRAVRVICQCGTEKIKTYFSLRNGDSKSCGCKSRERSFEAAWKRIYHNVLRGSRVRGLEVHLTLPLVKVIAKLPCAYCGKEPSNVSRSKYGGYKSCPKRVHDPSMDILYSGIDRIDSSIGYVEGNVVPCCADCNIAKNKMPLDVFLGMVDRIRAHDPSVAQIRFLAETVCRGMHS